MSLNPNDEEIILAILRISWYIRDAKLLLTCNLWLKSNHNEAQVQAVLQIKRKNIVEYQSKNNDTTLVLMKFEKTEEQ
jgi:hypothetical protein